MKSTYNQPLFSVLGFSFENITLDPASGGDLVIGGGDYEDYIGDGAED